MKPIDLETAKRLIDFSGKDESLKQLAEIQIEGAVALQNMIADPKIGMGYLADEVGMGKTYIALGVVAMMRYFNPMLRVLYICPSRNIQEKWEREYKSFIRRNVNVNQGRIRTQEGSPAAPYKSCRNVMSLLHAATSGYYADYFIGKDSFSISLSDDESTWERKRDELKALVPAHEWEGVIENKIDVKYQYASALNYILPTFDLVVIDEAHNFKHNFGSSNRNDVLSRVLGFNESQGYIPRVKNALLLSATPYDRNLNQLRNQLKLIGRSDHLPTDIDDENQDQVREKLSRFMVRRLNRLRVNDIELTRNMYRREWRKGPKAEIALETDEQKLVTALVQKKVGEMLDRQTESPSFQMGLLSSFESFAESAGSGAVEFDGERSEKQETDAKDRHVIAHISDSYKFKYELGRALPHPKMDTVVKRLSLSLFEEGKKQLVFVRRVKSVSELKDKLDDAYNLWIKKHIDEVLKSNHDERNMLNGIYESYLTSSNKGDGRDIGGELQSIDEDDEKSLPAKNDTFYAWFFRGEVLEEASSQLKTIEGSYPTPDAVRKGLSAKTQVLITFFEPNWAWYFCMKSGLILNDLLECYGKEIAKLSEKYISNKSSEGHLDIYQACQNGFIEWFSNSRGMPYLTSLLSSPHNLSNESIGLSELTKQLNTSTLYTELEIIGLSNDIIPIQSELYEVLKNQNDMDKSDLIRNFDIHKTLLSFLLRASHGIIDLYMARLKQGATNLTQDSRYQWIKDFVDMLAEQKYKGGFSTYSELTQLSSNLQLIIKNNIPDVLESNKSEYANTIQRALSPMSPIIGASGETSGRSSQARKFRMPGYPLALVSTDVFQEGEDLHTFCDSVMHFGLSGSPVSLEQKVGRVDRVGSMAQRRLQLLKRDAQDDEFIQVTFPYVKESLEVFQVRKICDKYNAFIKSLHEWDTNIVPTDDNLNFSDEVQSSHDIPDQILKKLSSPYEPTFKVNNKFNSFELIQNNEVKRKSEISYVTGLVEEKLKEINQTVTSIKFVKDEYEEPYPTLSAKLKSARSSGELLLSLMKCAEPDIYQLTNKKSLLEKMLRTSWPAFHRTIAIESPNSKGSYQLYSNAEMLVGGGDLTHPIEIDRLFERMDIQHDPKKYKTELSKDVLDCIYSINENTQISVDRSQKTRLHIEKTNGVTSIVFKFGDSLVRRIQKVMLYECDNRCVFISKSTMPGFAENLSMKDILKHTWLRNRHIDLVEFVVNPDHAIVGRVVHPIDNICWDEFIYCAYTLAVESDNLEYLLNNIDLH